MSRSKNEIKLSKDHELYLGIGKKNTVNTAYTLLDLYYGYVFTKINTDSISLN